MGRFRNNTTEAGIGHEKKFLINRFEIKENALDLIAKVCAPQDNNDLDACFTEYFSKLNQKNDFGLGSLDFYEFIRQGKYDHFKSTLERCFSDIKEALSAHENTSDTQVVVAGAFNSGKSTFLNTITGYDHLLPTDTNPSSVVNTFVYCSKTAKSVSVKAVNLKNAIVKLDTDILQCIQHSSKSNVYIASVLDKLFVELPANKQTSGLVFIDTPGYNKSDVANESNGKTDLSTALSAFEKGNVLFWVINIQKGTIPDNDLGMIRTFLDLHKDDKNAKVVVIFSQADKKAKVDLCKIVNLAASLLDVKNNGKILDIITFSVEDISCYYSYYSNSFEKLLEKVKRAGNGYSEVNNILTKIKNAFDDEILEKYIELNDLMTDVQNLKGLKNDEFKGNYNQTVEIEEHIKKIENIMLDSYSRLSDFPNRYNYIVNNYNGFRSYYNNVLKYGSSRWGDSSEYEEAVRNANRYNFNCSNDYVTTIPEYVREIEFQWIQKRLKGQSEAGNNGYNELVDKIDFCGQKIKKIEYSRNYWLTYKEELVRALEVGIERAIKNKPQVYDATVSKKTDKTIDIFNAIFSKDFTLFEKCFAEGEGVSLEKYNAQGYSPLTYAISLGQNEMVKFFIDHKADLRKTDDRNMNSIQTAVENNYKDICELLIASDKNILNLTYPDGKDLMSIARSNSFDKWLDKKLK